jgi:hypothetical protein
MRWAELVARMGKGRGVYRVLVEKPEGNRQLGRPRRRWEDNIRMDLQEVGCRGMDLLYNYYCGGDMQFTAQNVPIQFPPVLLVKADWPLGRGYRIGERRVI